MASSAFVFYKKWSKSGELGHILTLKWTLVVSGNLEKMLINQANFNIFLKFSY